MAKDANFSKVFMLLPFDGIAGQIQAPGFTDVGPSSRIITSRGYPILSSDGPFVGTTSIIINGTTHYAELKDTPDFRTGGNFTVEGWFKPTLGGVLLSSRDPSGTYGVMLQMQYDTGLSKVRLVWQQWTPTYQDNNATSTWVSVLAGWVFCQVQRVGDVITAYINQVSGGSVTLTARPAVGSLPFTLFKDSGANAYYSGLVADFRITIGGNQPTTIPTQSFPRGAVELTGVIRDANGALCSRRIHLIRRSDGKYMGGGISNATTGIYSINSATTDEVYVVAMDDGAGTIQNDLIKRAYPA